MKTRDVPFSARYKYRGRKDRTRCWTYPPSMSNVLNNHQGHADSVVRLGCKKFVWSWEKNP